MNNMITKLKENQIFVFGSNLAGRHAGGAAKQAHKDFGAEWGISRGRTGQSYAFPTLDKEMNQLPIEELKNEVKYLYEYCEGNKDQTFLLTKVGCGIAQIRESVMKSLFTNPPKNLVLPEDWKN